ncbi:MAG: undecaprenyl/decaprenyl-phosphate alpha-N-acetylglucosaminyl 1-phosphate transferase [Pirellulales bacterium]|nr:undecaprenyl/decaprenyl-phosphate alpha-N-acetylglucosaminyl 1-phosphate transferase [Pirellulales bacterium]
MWALLPAAAVLLVVGLIDDAHGLTGIYKLAGQVLSASLLVAGGFRFDVINLFGWEFPLGDFGVPLSLFFCLGAINAFNLIDGSDALAASIGAVVCITLGVITVAQGEFGAALLSFGVAGALVGFLRFNAPPARIYLGDTGSMLIGLVVAAVAIGCSIKEQTATVLAVPVAICAIPILDAAAAMVRRITTGQSVFTPDRGHLHHALLLRGLSVGQTAAAAAGLTALTCAGALASYFSGYQSIAVVTTIIVFSALAAGSIFGHAELRLISSHTRLLGRRFIGRCFVASNEAEGSDHSIQIQGARQWNRLWDALREAAQRYDLVAMKLIIAIPQLHESFYASWKCTERLAVENGWRLTLPLSSRGVEVGRLAVVGSEAGAAALLQMQRWIDYLEEVDPEIELILSRGPCAHGTTASVSCNEVESHDFGELAGVGLAS